MTQHNDEVMWQNRNTKPKSLLICILRYWSFHNGICYLDLLRWHDTWTWSRIFHNLGDVNKDWFLFVASTLCWSISVKNKENVILFTLHSDGIPWFFPLLHCPFSILCTDYYVCFLFQWPLQGKALYFFVTHPWLVQPSLVAFSSLHKNYWWRINFTGEWAMPAPKLLCWIQMQST